MTWYGLTVTERFWSKVDRRGPDECWPWLRSLDTSGYGRFYLKIDGGRRIVAASRVAFRLTHGRWPKHKALHTCDNPRCCNPAHIYDGTQQQNVRDRDTRGRHASNRITHCPQGHSYAEHGARRPNGHRWCRRCASDRKARRRYQRTGGRA